ncbi:pyochelin biosynthesis editing thioesterase PchC [Streptomyces coacervatus]|uniref:Pyochelin biosynthesis editing thioesterase PchC n=1 Tax=Streptomyces coacervatus TaxID=647381 RepID=A0ABP7H3P1_9ACTN|nr:alpha/beta fold hydrolase [Streptomyces coacervatus]MDF2271577.1 thioesterase domain-containing protein [Streptomyces coacervatus]
MPPTHLICLPFSGGGTAFFRKWQEFAPDGLTIVPVLLPGREDRILDPPYEEVSAAIDDMLPALSRTLAGAESVAFFGHCLGAVLGFELAHRVARSGEFRIDHLFASGAPAPPQRLRNLVSDLDDDAFLIELTRFIEYSHPALQRPELREFLLPTLRADVRMHENYRPSTTEPLKAALTILRGRDDNLVSAEEMEGWTEVSAQPLTRHQFEGGHMYLVDQAAELLEFIEARVSTPVQGSHQ